VSRNVPESVADDGADHPPSPIDMLLHAAASDDALAEVARAEFRHERLVAPAGLSYTREVGCSFS
jgi:hypothetical protein